MLPNITEHGPAHQIKMVSDASAQSGELQNAVTLKGEIKDNFFALAYAWCSKQYINIKEILY